MDVDSPLVSVIMPAFNAAEFIKESIESILNQTYPNFELLICDDGSTDKTWHVIHSINDHRIKCFQNVKNIGNLKTTNFLFDQCAGDFITIQDADDFSTDNRFEILIDVFRENELIGMVGSNYLVINLEKEPQYCGNLPLTSSEIDFSSKKEVIPMLYASIMVRKELVIEVGGFSLFFNRKGYADFDWMSRIQEKSRVMNVKNILYFYRKHSNSFTTKSKLKHSAIYHDLLVEMHLRRIKGDTDLFQANDKKRIKRLISNIYLRKGESFFWSRKKGFFRFCFLSLKVDPFNIITYKTLYYIYKKIIFSFLKRKYS